MSDPQAFGENGHGWSDVRYGGETWSGVQTVSMNDESGANAAEASTGSAHGLESVLSGVKGVFAETTAHLDRVYHELAQREADVQRREHAVREAEHAVARAREDAAREAIELRERAHAEAAQIAEAARRERQESLARAEAEGAQIVERARGVEQQMAQRLAELGRREQELRDRDEQAAENARKQQSEREWLNQYAQTLSGIAADLERAVSELQPIK